MHIYNTPGTDVNGRNVEEHLRYQYKRFVKETKRNLRYKPVRWIGFPTAFEDFDTTEMVAPYWPPNAPPRRQAVTRLRACRTATFYATLGTLDYDQRRGGYYSTYGYEEKKPRPIEVPTCPQCCVKLDALLAVMPEYKKKISNERIAFTHKEQ